MSGEPVDLSILRALAPACAQARLVRRRGDSDDTCPRGHVFQGGEVDEERKVDDVVEVVVGAEALAQLCAGHFPGRPIVPGSHLVALMVDVAGLLTAFAGGEIIVQRAVFRAPVGAEGRLWIRARHGRTPGRVDAEVLRGGGLVEPEASTERSLVASARLELVR